MGEVWLAELQGAGAFRRRVVLKVLAPERRGDPRLAAMLADEARVVGLLHHPGIVVALDYLETDEHGPIFVLEFVDGASLRTVLKLARRHHAVLPSNLAAYVGAEVARALHAAHTAIGSDGQPLGLVHRDVAPDNVLLSRSGVVYLGDFGVARAAGNAETTEPGVAPKGKRGYMAPEQALGRGVGPQSDIFSLGRLVAEAADAGASAELRAVLEKATEEKPLDRYATASELAVALIRACPPPADPAGALARWLQEHAPEALLLQKTNPGVSARLEPVPAGRPAAGDHHRVEPEPRLFASVRPPSRKIVKLVAAGGALAFILLPLLLLHSAERRERFLTAAIIGTPGPSHGDLRVTSRPVEAEVYVDGRLRGLTPLLVELSAGKHAVRVGSPRLEHWRAAEVNVRDNTEHRLDVDLSE